MSSSPPDLAARLSTSLPSLLTNLAHEPSLGLHVVASHARAAAVPTLVATRRTLQTRSSTMRDRAVDAHYAVDALREWRTSALPALRRVEALLRGADSKTNHR